jgi:hypothetical protein
MFRWNSPPVAPASSFCGLLSAKPASVSALKNLFASSTPLSQSFIFDSPRSSQTLNALAHTQEFPQLESFHAYTSYFADTPDGGVPQRPSLSPASSFFFHTLATRRSCGLQKFSNSNPIRRLRHLSLDTQEPMLSSSRSGLSQPRARLKPVADALQKRCPAPNVHLASGLVCPGGF